MRRVDCHHRHWRNLCPRTRTKQLTRHGTITNRRHRAQESTRSRDKVPASCRMAIPIWDAELCSDAGHTARGTAP